MEEQPTISSLWHNEHPESIVKAIQVPEERTRRQDEVRQYLEAHRGDYSTLRQEVRRLRQEVKRLRIKQKGPLHQSDVDDYDEPATLELVDDVITLMRQYVDIVRDYLDALSDTGNNIPISKMNNAACEFICKIANILVYTEEKSGHSTGTYRARVREMIYEQIVKFHEMLVSLAGKTEISNTECVFLSNALLGVSTLLGRLGSKTFVPS